VLKTKIPQADIDRYKAILEKTDYSYKIDLSPVRDDNPFPYNVFKEKKEVIKILRVVSLLSLIIFIPVLILVILKYSSHKLTLLRHSLFFISVGFGYMLVEIVLMQFLQQFIGIPIYSIIITLGALLFFSGVGSLLCASWNRKVIMAIMFLIPVLIFVYHSSLYHVFNYFAASTFNVRMAAGVGIMFPLSLLMGMPFPKAMERIKKEISNEYATLMYAISGAAGTIATTTALLLNVTYGFSFTFIVGMIAYIIAALLLLTILRGE
jgi:MFS family permease